MSPAKLTTPRRHMGRRIDDPKVKRFIEAYLVTGNAADAVRKAGYKCRTVQATSTQGRRLLNDAEVRREIERRKAAIVATWEENTDLSLERVKEQLRRCCFYDPRRLYMDNELLTPDKLPDDMAAVVQGFQWFEKGRLKYLLPDRVDALEKAMRFFGMFEKDKATKSDPLMEFLTEMWGKPPGLDSLVKPQPAAAASTEATSTKGDRS